MTIQLTIDVEAHRTIEEFGLSNKTFDHILAVLRRNHIKAVFYVDYCGIKTWGLAPYQEITQKLLDNDQIIQLHAHPHHYFKNNKWLLNSYSYQEQKEVIEYVIEQHKLLTRSDPTHFRAGGFSANNDTIYILDELGIKFDSSLLLGHKNCKIDPDSLDQRFIQLIPLQSIYTLKLGTIYSRLSCLDFNWLPLYYIEILLRRRIFESNVILLHSSSLLYRVNKKFYKSRKLIAKIERFCELYNQINKGNLKYCKNRIPLKNKNIYIERNVLLIGSVFCFQIGKLLLFSVKARVLTIILVTIILWVTTL